MTDESPFASFVPSTEAPAEPKPGKKKGKDKKTKPKKTKPKEAKAPAEPKPDKPKRTRKPRQSRIFKIGIGAAIIALAGLSAEDVELLRDAAAPLIDAPKKQRERVVVALAKIFA